MHAPAAEALLEEAECDAETEDAAEDPQAAAVEQQKQQKPRCRHGGTNAQDEEHFH